MNIPLACEELEESLCKGYIFAVALKRRAGCAPAWSPVGAKLLQGQCFTCNRYIDSRRGFTLIELSIVLVIIGLIIGGALVGRDLISAAKVRAQISQMEKYNTAVHTFQLKYNNYLPGDIPDPSASNFGFAARGTYAGQGDGNGIIEGVASCTGNNWGVYQTAGETAMFWVDLSTAKMIDGTFNSTNSTCPLYGITAATVPTIGQLVPTAKIGNGNYVLAQGISGINYFSIGGITELDFGNVNSIVYHPAVSVAQAYSIDSKVDDGLPQTGRVIAFLETYTGSWVGVFPGNAALPSANTCYDNGGNTSNAMAYSLSQNNGSGLNCALSFQFQ